MHKQFLDMQLFNAFYLIVFCFLFTSIAKAQSDSLATRPAFWGLDGQVAFIIPHSDELEPISNSNPLIFSASWGRLMNTARSWENCGCYTLLSANFSYTDFGNPEVLGQAYTLAFAAEPYLGLKSPLFASLRGSIGASFLNQVYDEETNPQNLFYSSPISFLLQAALKLNYRFTPHWTGNIGAYYNHISNGGMRQPNKGINYPALGLGLTYFPQGVTLPKRAHTFQPEPGFDWYGRLFGTWRSLDESTESDNRRFPQIGIAGGVQKRIARLLALSTGPELIYSGLYREQGKQQGETVSPWILGWMGGAHFIFGNFDFNQQFGVYLARPDAFVNDRFYQRYELAWQPNKWWLVGISLTAHGHVAQNIDVRTGFLIPSRK